MPAENLIRHYEGKKLAKDYAELRPLYPPMVKNKILEYLRSQKEAENGGTKFRRMLDVGCGGGQSTHMFASYFDEIIGIDISAGQIATAKENNPNNNVTFQLVNDNTFPVEDESLDLVTCATAFHWLNVESFTRECQRSLKPGGCIAIYAYIPVSIAPTGDRVPDADISWRFYEIHSQFYEECKADARNYLVWQKYRPVYDILQSPNKRNIDGLKIESDWNLSVYKRGWSTIGEYRTFMQNNPPFNPLDRFGRRIKSLLKCNDLPDEEVKFTITIAYPMILLHK